MRQRVVCRLLNDYGYSAGQMAEEMPVAGPGSGQARADIVVWRSAWEKQEGKTPLLVVECKSGSGPIPESHLSQGENYARLTGAAFLVACNETRIQCWRVLHDRMPKALEPVAAIPHAPNADPTGGSED